MQRVLYFFLIVAANAEKYTTTQSDFDQKMDFDEESLRRSIRKEALTLPRKKFVYTELGCYVGHSMCFVYNRKLRRTEVCAHHPVFKLVNFVNLCEVALQNCLYLVDKTLEKPNVPELFYFNQQIKNCKHYTEKEKKLEDAIKRYYAESKPKR